MHSIMSSYQFYLHIHTEVSGNYLVLEVLGNCLLLCFSCCLVRFEGVVHGFQLACGILDATLCGRFEDQDPPSSFTPIDGLQLVPFTAFYF